MAVLIPDMKMPKSCTECRMLRWFHEDNSPIGICNITGQVKAGQRKKVKLTQGCPLVDADDLQETIRKLKEELQIASYKLTDRIVTVVKSEEII